MASSWGNSFGTSWANSWGVTTPTPTPTPVPKPTSGGGGYWPTGLNDYVDPFKQFDEDWEKELKRLEAVETPLAPAEVVFENLISPEPTKDFPSIIEPNHSDKLDKFTDAISKGLPQNKPPVIDPDIALILAMYEASE